MNKQDISVIEFLNKDTDYNFQSQLDVSIKTCVSDPQNSIIKSFKVLEHLIDELYFGYHLKKESDDMYKLINGLSKVITEDIRNDMHTIRIIRNKASHKQGDHYIGTLGNEVDFSEAIFVLKKLYDLLAWFVNLEQDSIYYFLPFQNLLDEILDKSIEKKVIEPQNKHTKEQEETSIGVFIQTKVMDLIEHKSISEEEINNFLGHEYSYVTFGLKVPFLSTSRSGKMKSRYYSKPVKINGKRYYISNSWNDNNKPLLYQWYEGLISKIKE